MRRIAVAFVVLVAAGAWADPRAAAGGVNLFRALERAPLAVVATVAAPRALDDEAYAASAVPSVVLRGDPPFGPIHIAWEERSRSRPVRFVAGQSVLMALERLPGASIWRQRIADPQQRARTLTLAERGGAFVRDPSPGSIRLVEHFLKLPADLREGNPGVAHLILMAEGAQPTLAGAALARLADVRRLNRALDEISAQRLVSVLLREASELGDAVIALIELESPAALRAPLLARAPADASGPARIYAALGALDGSLDAARVTALWARDDSPEHRAVAARYSPKAQAPELARRLRMDASAEVRVEAVTRLAALEGTRELDRVLFALEDADPEVRLAAMRALSEMGGEAVPGLRRVVRAGTPDAARTAVGALRACGSHGIAALREIAQTHPDESVRTLARAALGGSIGHQD